MNERKKSDQKHALVDPRTGKKLKVPSTEREFLTVIYVPSVEKRKYLMQLLTACGCPIHEAVRMNPLMRENAIRQGLREKLNLELPQELSKDLRDAIFEAEANARKRAIEAWFLRHTGSRRGV